MQENKTMRILTALGIILIVAGHLNMDLLGFGGIFTYYSFHVYIFLFVAGYFYKKEDENNIPAYILRKIKTLLVPYYILHFIFGLISTFLNLGGIHVGGKLSIWSLLVDPFLGGHLYMLDFPGWFVPALFVTEIINILIRNVLGHWVKKQLDILMFILSLLLGVATVWLSIGGHIWGYRSTPARWLLMLFGVEFGCLFKNKIEPLLEKILEKYVNKKILLVILYFLLIIVVQLPIWYISGGLAFSVVWSTSFANGPIIPFVTVITGILLWLGIAYILAQLSDNNIVLKGFFAVGRNSFGIMMGHIAILFFINSLCGLLNRYGNLFKDFDFVKYAEDVNYQYLYAGWNATHLINLLLCVAIPVMISIFCKKLTKKNMRSW